MDKLVYTVRETAKVLNMGMNTTYSLVSRNDFPKIQVGRKILVPIKALEKWIESTCKV